MKVKFEEHCMNCGGAGTCPHTKEEKEDTICHPCNGTGIITSIKDVKTLKVLKDGEWITIKP